jgi:MOSC domain-containing protein YiiM
MRIGDVELEISKPCDPCTETYSLPYIGEARGPAFVRALVGRRGWYARVLTGGRLTLETPVDLVREGVIIRDA